ncbi:hypothetical protein [Candidatus Magnetaquiglobus chichijimensis]|uniref:hypothetical protein n=1 Tax=Candidatus Magnetaquiglobus chichijimensis TaxID=3141448 RepID=UPI003B96F3B4
MKVDGFKTVKVGLLSHAGRGSPGVVDANRRKIVAEDIPTGGRMTLERLMD